jgi:hypothetical protein
MFFRSGMAVFFLMALAGFAQAQTLDAYQTGFENTGGFIPGIYNTGQYLDALNNWQVESGTASVQTTLIHSGQQAVEIAPLGSLDSPRSGGNSQVIWLQGVYRTTPQSEAPDISGLGPSTALMYFDSDQGIMVYDGALSQWVAVGQMTTADEWYRITFRLDFDSKTYDVYVGENQLAEDIGFKDSLSSYNGFRCRSGAGNTGYLDDFYVSEQAPDNILTPTPTVPPITGGEVFFYSSLWQQSATAQPTAVNETDYFELLNLEDSDQVIDWLDLYELQRIYPYR